VSGDVESVLSPILAHAGLELVDLEVHAGLLRITVDRDGGVDLDTLAEVSRRLSAALDHAGSAVAGSTLEVSSPGVERRLRTPAHFSRAVGETVSVRTVPEADGERRVQGTLVSADASGFVLEGPDAPGGSIRFAYTQVERARTVFVWGPVAPSKRNSRSRGTRRPQGSDDKTERVAKP
jgi:ribosome maturation factor RimP